MKQSFEISPPSIRAKILVVDDDPAVLCFLEDLLTDDGYQVVAVENGEAALAQIGACEFDLAMIDLKMEGMEGIEVLTELRQRAPDTSTIILTAHGSLGTAVEALRQGAHDYLLKPCKPDEIRERVQSALDARQRGRRQRDLIADLHRLSSSFLQDIPPPASEPLASSSVTPDSSQEQPRFLQRGGLIVDYVRRQITLDGHPLELSATEFDLLAYIIGEAPRVVSAQELVREVRGYESKPWEASKAVRSHIHHIRQKIASTTGRKDIIQTVRGTGYVIGE
ncbi:MAG: response regulator transcription factor [Anaerolineae bacterium]